MYYGDKQDSLIAIMQGLEFRGWSIYGYKGALVAEETIKYARIQTNMAYIRALEA